MTEQYGLRIPVRRETRYERVLGVPTIDLWAAGDSMIFHRFTGILDSGAARTILGFGARTILGLGGHLFEELITTPGGEEIVYPVHRIQFRLPVAGWPPVTLCLEVGIKDDFGHNYFAADLLRYFTVVIEPDQVTFLADAEGGET